MEGQGADEDVCDDIKSNDEARDRAGLALKERVYDHLDEGKE